MTDTRHQPIERIAASVRAHERFLVTTHVRPDGDAVGSLLAVTAMLRQLGKTVHPYCQDPVPAAHRFLPGVDEIRDTCDDPQFYDAAVLVDCGEFKRVGPGLAQAIAGIPTVINIDHHLSREPFGTVHWVDPTFSSTSEMLFVLSQRLPLRLDAAIATQLYTGLLTDTGSFRFSNTTQRALEVATQLVAAGAQPAQIAQHVYESGSAERLRLLARVLTTLNFHGDHRLATAELTLAMFAQTGATQADSEGFIDLLRSVRSVLIAALFRESTDGLIHVSLRSKGATNVATYAQRHGGGGHRNAAAFRVQGLLREVKQRTINELVDYLG